MRSPGAFAVFPILVAAAVAVPRAAPAQELPRLVPGARLRAFTEEPESVAVLTELQISRGRRGRVGRRAFLGALIGTGAGLLGFVVLHSALYEETSSGYDFSLMLAPVAAIGGGLMGAGVGAASGAIFRSEQWETIWPDDRRR